MRQRPRPALDAWLAKVDALLAPVNEARFTTRFTMPPPQVHTPRELDQAA